MCQFPISSRSIMIVDCMGVECIVGCMGVEYIIGYMSIVVGGGLT